MPRGRLLTFSNVPVLATTCKIQTTMSGIVLLLFGTIVVILKGVIVKNLEDLTQSARRREQLSKYYSMFQKLDKDGDGYISRKEFESGWSTTSSEDTNNTDYRHVSLVWNETWIDVTTGNPSTFTGKSSKEAENPLEREELRETRNLKNFPSRLLDKDDKGKISKEEFEEGYELVQTFLDYEDGDDTALCHLLHAKYKDEKNKQKANTSSYDLVVELGHESVDAIPSGWSPVLPQASVTSKYDPETLNFGCSTVAAQGLRSVVGLDDDTVRRHR
jgi:Ca2+-binding EF-hand superfamily protein